MASARKPKAAFFGNDNPSLDRVYGGGRREMVAQRVELFSETVTSETFEQHADRLQDVEAIFSTWGMPGLETAQIARMKSLKAVFYAAGSVQYFARPLLDCGVKVISAWAANAIPVAEFSLAQILLSTKGYFRNMRECKSPERRSSPVWATSAKRWRCLGQGRSAAN